MFWNGTYAKSILRSKVYNVHIDVRRTSMYRLLCIFCKWNFPEIVYCYFIIYTTILFWLLYILINIQYTLLTKTPISIVI